jgi:cobalt-zinc-cadmium efflux system outer membrane protein
MHSHVLKGFIIIMAALAAGCAQVPKNAGFSDVQHLVGRQVDYRLHWNQGSEEDKEVAQTIERLLAEELSVDAAVQISLLNNQRLQATYEELGVTQADVVKAGLLENPVLFGRVRYPDRSPSLANLEFEITQNFLNILMLPARKQLVNVQFERIKLKTANEVLAQALAVQTAYYEALGAKQIQHIHRQITLAAQASYEMARQLHKAGNISDLDLANERGQYEQTRVALARSETELLAAREKLTREMGLWGSRTAWKIPDRLPEVPPQEISLANLESLAIENRFDLASARKEAEVLAQALGITLDWRWIGSAEVGFSTERDTDGQWVSGPSLAVEIPIFDQQQTEIARLEAQLRQSQKRLAALAVEIRSEVRALRSRLLMQRDLIEHYLTVILPLRERIVNLTMKEYNYMLTGVFELLQAKQQAFADYQNYIEAVRDYWITRAQLQRAMGARLQSPGRHSEADRPAGVSKDLSKNLTVSDNDVRSDTVLINHPGSHDDSD